MYVSGPFVGSFSAVSVPDSDVSCCSHTDKEEVIIKSLCERCSDVLHSQPEEQDSDEEGEEGDGRI